MSKLRRLPWSAENGGNAFVQDGNGTVNQLADAVEAGTLQMARTDAQFALELLDESDVSKAELKAVVRMLAHAVQDVANVADMRAERLPAGEPNEAALKLQAALNASMRRG